MKIPFNSYGKKQGFWVAFKNSDSELKFSAFFLSISSLSRRRHIKNSGKNVFKCNPNVDIKIVILMNIISSEEKNPIQNIVQSFTVPFHFSYVNQEHFTG